MEVVMEIQQFIEKFASLFDNVDVSSLSAATKFKTLEEWSSLMALSVIAFADEEYGVAIKGKDIREAETIEDLFNAIKALKS